jgi:hypothetical protein
MTNAKRYAWHPELILDDADRHLFETHWLKASMQGPQKRVYARNRTGGKYRPIGRVILDAPDGLVVDHINGNPMDNRRANLRLCTTAENSRNRRSPRKGSQFKGVSRHADGKWQAQVFVNVPNAVAALYVETGGCYFGLPGVDPWDERAMRAATPARILSSRTRPASGGASCGPASRCSSSAPASARSRVTMAAVLLPRWPQSASGAAFSSIRGAAMPGRTSG